MSRQLRFWMPMMVAALPACSVESRIVGTWDIASAHLLRAAAVANSPATHAEAEATGERRDHPLLRNRPFREWAIDGAAGGFNLRSQQIVEWSPAQRECWVWELELR
jgi:hypothetical protein